MRNLERKFRCENLTALRERALALGARPHAVLHQTDTFFPAIDGRLKLRDFENGTGELIAYQRPDSPAARESDYEIARTMEPEALCGVLRRALGTSGVVRKRREVLLWRHTRIHLDEVAGLGDFLELETVLDGLTESEGRAEMETALRALAPAESDAVAVAYVDILTERS